MGEQKQGGESEYRQWPDGTERRPPAWHQKWSEDELRIVVTDEFISILTSTLSEGNETLRPLLDRYHPEWDRELAARAEIEALRAEVASLRAQLLG